jgi:hypothetical protein
MHLSVRKAWTIACVLVALAWASPLVHAQAGSQDPFADVATIIASGDLARADRTLRRLADDDRYRLRASQSLHQLHQRRDFDLQSNEAAIERTQARVGARMRRYESAHFVVLSDCDAPWTRSKIALLERTRHQYLRFVEQIGMLTLPPEHKLLCVMFAEHEQYAEFAASEDKVNAPWAGGYFATQANRVVIFDDRQSPAILSAHARLDEHAAQAVETRSRAAAATEAGWSAMADALVEAADRIDADVAAGRQRLDEHAERLASAKTIHEAVHLLAYNTRLQSLGKVYPFWVSEGLATAFETANPDQSFGPRHPYHEREESFDRLVREGRLLPLRQVVAVPAGLEGADRLGDSIYSQSYVLFTHLARTSPDAMRRYFEDLNAAPSRQFDPDYHIALFEKHFGRVSVLERTLSRGRGGAVAGVQP